MYTKRSTLSLLENSKSYLPKSKDDEDKALIALKGSNEAKNKNNKDNKDNKKNNNNNDSNNNNNNINNNSTEELSQSALFSALKQEIQLQRYVYTFLSPYDFLFLISFALLLFDCPPILRKELIPQFAEILKDSLMVIEKRLEDKLDKIETELLDKENHLRSELKRLEKRIPLSDFDFVYYHKQL